MSIFKAFETDAGMVEKGFWADFGEDGGQWLLAFAGEGNKAYQKELERRMRPFRVALDIMNTPSERVTKVVQEVWAKMIVLEWKGVVGDDDQPIPYSEENVLMVFQRAPAVWQRIVKIATDHNNYLKSVLDNARKN